MNEEILKIVFGELKKSGVKPIDYDYNVDKFVSDPVEVMNSPFLRGDEIPSFWDFSEHDKSFEDEIGKLKGQIVEYLHDINELFNENEELKQRIAELASEKAENCEEKTISDDARPSAEWYENRYQQDCITINRLNTTIDVLIHKIEYLRQFAGLE